MSNYLENQKRFLSVRQPNALTEARYEMTSLQKDIFYLLLMQLRKDNPLKKKYSISIKNINHQRNARVRRAELLQAAEGLIEAGIIIYSNEKKDFEALGILASAEYGDEADQDNLIIEFDLGLMPYLLDVAEKFTLLNLQHALNLKSKYSKRIYEMLSQFREQYKYQKAKNQECIINISVQELKERFKLINPKTGKEKYPDFGVFSQNVLAPAMREINGHTEISYECTPVPPTSGKKITKVQFKITDIDGIEILEDLSETSPQSSKELPESTEKVSQVLSLEERLRKQCKISKKLSKKVVESFHAEKIELVIKGILKKYQDRKIENLGGYSKTIFEEWIDGAEPKFEKTNIQTKHIPLKSTSQTNQIAVLEDEIGKKLEYGLGLEYYPKVYNLIVNYGGELEKLENLQSAINKVEEEIDRGEVEKDLDAIYEAIISKLIGVPHFSNQTSIAQSNERLNSINSLGNILASSIKKPNIQPESVEEEKIRREKTKIWNELFERFENMDDKETNSFVEEYCVEALKYSISKVVDELESHKTPQDPVVIMEALREYASLWKP